MRRLSKYYETAVQIFEWRAKLLSYRRGCAAQWEINNVLQTVWACCGCARVSDCNFIDRHGASRRNSNPRYPRLSGGHTHNRNLLIALLLFETLLQFIATRVSKPAELS